MQSEQHSHGEHGDSQFGTVCRRTIKSSKGCRGRNLFPRPRNPRWQAPAARKGGERVLFFIYSRSAVGASHHSAGANSVPPSRRRQFDRGCLRVRLVRPDSVYERLRRPPEIDRKIGERRTRSVFPVKLLRSRVPAGFVVCRACLLPHPEQNFVSHWPFG